MLVIFNCLRTMSMCKKLFASCCEFIVDVDNDVCLIKKLADKHNPINNLVQQ